MTETNISHIILDRTENIYRLVGNEDNYGLRSILVSEDCPAGKLDLIYESPAEWTIANLELFAEAPKTSIKWFQKQLRDFNLWKPPTIDYRRRGLGTALLAFVEEHAHQRQVQRITGHVVRRDYMAWPPLLDWYRSHGFVVVPTLDIDRAGDIAVM